MTSGEGLEATRAALQAACNDDEQVVPLLPERLPIPFWPRDRPWPEALRAGVIEPRRGYRHRPENLVWAALATKELPGRIIELGAGSGSLLLGAAAAWGGARGIGIERQEAVAERLRRTLDAHGLLGPEALQVVTGDLRNPEVLAAAGVADLVVANPPFYPEGWGRPSANPEVHASTHALHGGVQEFLAAAVEVLSADGAVWVVYDAGRLAELLVAAGNVSLGLNRMLWIPDTRAGRTHQATRVWARFTRSGAPIVAFGSLAQGTMKA